MIKMNYLLYVSLIGFFSGTLGTVGGGLIVLLVREIKTKFLSIILGISSGIMTVVIFLDLIPEAQITGSIWSSLTGLFLGAMLISILDMLFPHQNFVSIDDDESHYLKAGILLAVGIALHNIPEGLAIGAGYSSADNLGLGLAVIMAVQNFPEGMAVATTLSLAGLKNVEVILITLLSGIPMGIGSFLGAYLGNISNLSLSISLGLAAGAMLYITFDGLIPDAHKKAEGYTAIFGIINGVFLGLILSNFL